MTFKIKFILYDNIMHQKRYSYQQPYKSQSSKWFAVTWRRHKEMVGILFKGYIHIKFKLVNSVDNSGIG